jgi:hypothetical protein
MRRWLWVTWLIIGGALLALDRFDDSLSDEVRTVADTVALIVTVAFGWVTILSFRSDGRNFEKEMDDVGAAMRRPDDPKR